MLQLAGKAQLAPDGKDLPKVQLLRYTNDVQDALRLPSIDAMLDGGDVAGAVQK